MEATITIKVEAPTSCTEQQFIEWIKWELALADSIDAKNPLDDFILNVKQSDIKIH